MDALIVLLVVVATVLVFDPLASCFEQDSRSIADDAWARPRSWTQASQMEC